MTTKGKGKEKGKEKYHRCYYCSFSSDIAQDYQQHVKQKHPSRPVYQSRKYLMPIPDYGLIGEIKDAIKNALIAEGFNIDVKDSDCPVGFNGNKPDNIVNRLGIKGIQIEQCRKAHDGFHEVIAQAVVNAIGPRFNV